MFRTQGFIALLSLAASFGTLVHAQIVITNDDGWATAQIRAQYEALVSADYNVILSAPALEQFGKGSQTTPPQPLEQPCQFDTCSTGSPAVGYDANDPRLNYVNAYPVDAANYGVQVLSPKWFGDRPYLLVSGPSVGAGVGPSAQLSGTVGAACAASLNGVPATAFSGVSGAQVSYTTLESTPNANSTRAARIYSALTEHFVTTLFNGVHSNFPVLPEEVIVNINYASISDCSSPNDYQWVFTRNERESYQTDVYTCKSHHLPSEEEVALGKGCYASVSAISAVTKTDVDALTQASVWGALRELPFSCYNN